MQRFASILPKQEFQACSPDSTGAQLGNLKGKGCMVEMGHEDTGFQIETLGPLHDTSTFISF